MLSLKHSERVTLNVLVRETLKQNGVLKNESVTFDSLRPLSASIEEKSQLHFYQPGDVLRFNQKLPDAMITKSGYFEVANVHLEKGLIELHQKEQQIFWNPTRDKAFLKQVEIFKKETKEIQITRLLLKLF